MSIEVSQVNIIRNTFAISAMGRSGTRFLSCILNKSKTYHVEHEPRDFISGLVPKAHLKLAIQRFLHNRNKYKYYGEVNSYLRYVLSDLPVEHKLYIIRHPFSIVRSTFNWKQGKVNEVEETLDEIKRGMKFMMNVIKSGGVRFKLFEYIIYDADEIMGVAKNMGINDLNISPDDLKQFVNASRRQLISSFVELPKNIQEKTYHKLRDVIDMFYKDISGSNFNECLEGYLEYIENFERSYRKRAS